jgi:hypothetical protein
MRCIIGSKRSSVLVQVSAFSEWKKNSHRESSGERGGWRKSPGADPAATTAIPPSAYPISVKNTNRLSPERKAPRQWQAGGRGRGRQEFAATSVAGGARCNTRNTARIAGKVGPGGSVAGT